MKKLKWLLTALTALCLCFGTACNDKGGNDSSDLPTSESSSENIPDSGSSSENEHDWTAYETITIAQALELCGEEGNITTERYYIRGIIDSVTNAGFGAMIISDETGSISVYGTYSADGEINYSAMTEKPYKGDEVLLHCILQNYGGTKEVKNARLIDFISNQGKVDESAYTEMSIAEARNAAEGALVKVDGVVAQITYAFGMVPSGIYLVDETESIYVYDGDLAARVEKGNKITILASKTYWILEKEQNAAQKHGYKGCNQLEDVTLVSNDEGANAYNKEWIEENTVKNIMENPVENDITTTIYKVNALVNKVSGTNFVNYYFNDLDGETGSYVYTQCSGGDFAWLDEFHGKICTVYLSVINAKSTDSGCVYRLLPIEVIDEGYTFNTENAAQFAVEYYGVDQFETVYTADPAISLTTSVSSALLGFENATLSYSSSNEKVVSFAQENGETVFHCLETGSAVVTVTGAYNGKQYSKEITVTVEKAVSYDYISVAEAISATVDSDVVVKGIVGPSVVNKNGFYLFGEDGSMIAVLVNSVEEFVGLEIGHEIILKGMRERYVDDDSATWAGQTCIVNAEILVNNYGNTAYSTAKFVTDKTLADFYALDGAVDYSTTVFVLKATVSVEKTNYYTNLNLTSGATVVKLYASGAGQYEWLQAFAGQEVTIEITACNWNDKSYWRGCVLAVRTEDGKVLNTLNFDNY